MAPTPTSVMQSYCTNNPSLAQAAIERDEAAREYFGNGNFKLYQQGCAKVIALRAEAAPPGATATSTPINGGKKVHCSICDRGVHDFTRHNRETHVVDPGLIFFCPVGDCTKAIARDGLVTIDDHLAAAHADFRNKVGRGGEFLERTDKANVLSRLTNKSVQYVAEHRQKQVEEYETRRARLIHALNQAGLDYAKLAAATLPRNLQKGVVKIRTLKKKDMIAHAILVRKTLKRWDALLAEAEAMLE
ncbi:hypothetical protein N0V82_008281 [Gnomoniopsis sp. IMI 355080]|nr:hypothetical protein N0V82_008281 [Gnomoniopsis sp. IMI 355080]